MPAVLQSALMALENWLIECAEHTQDRVFWEWCFDYILRNSNSVMPTAILASIALGFPDKVGKSALPIIRSTELYDLDLQRRIHERGGREPDWFKAGLNRDPLADIYSEERRQAALRKWRNQDLESLIVRLQFSDLREETIAIIDELRSKFSADEKWRFRFHRIDTREFKPLEDRENNRIVFTNEHIESDLLKIQEETQREQELHQRFITLFLWADTTLKKEKPEREYYAGWEQAFTEAKELLQIAKDNNTSDFIRMQAECFVKSAVIFVRDYAGSMREEDLSWCFDIIIDTALAGADQEETSGIDYMGSPEGLAVAASVLPILLDFAGNEENRLAIRRIIVTALTHPNRMVRRQTANGVREYLWSRDAAFAQQCVIGNIVYAQQDMELYQRTFSGPDLDGPADTESPESESFASWINGIRDRLCQDSFSVNINGITFNSRSSEQLFIVSLMIPYGSDNPIHIALMKKVLLLFIQAEKDQNDNHDRNNEIEIDYQLPFDFAQYFARFLVSLPNEKTPVYLEELQVGCKIAPNFITSVLINLDYFTELSEEKDLFWNI